MSSLAVRADLYFIDAIVPAPKAVDYGNWFVLGDRVSGRANVRIILPSRPHPLERAAADAIHEGIRSLGLNRVSVEIENEGRVAEQGRAADLKILLGASGRNKALDAELDRIGLEAIDREEAYRIRTVRDARGTPLYLLQGSDLRGAFYAAQSYRQMLAVQRGRLAIRSLQVDDWPSFRSRASGNDEKPPPSELAAEAVDWLTRFKLNAWPLGQSYHWPEDWRDMPEDGFEAIHAASRQASSRALDVRYQIHPFGRSQDQDLRYTIQISSENDRAKFIQSIARAIEAGATEVLVRADDFHVLVPKDAETFSSKAEAHAKLINEAYAVIQKQSPDVRFYFCPPYYTGEAVIQQSEAKGYLQEIGRLLPGDIPILWTGPEVVSDAFTAAEQSAFNELVGRPALLWDNTVYQQQADFGYHYVYPIYLLQLQDTRYPVELPGLIEGVRFNFGFEDSWLNRIGNMVLADFLWNMEAFEPELALRRAIGICVGPRAVEDFRSAADQILTIFNLMHSPARWMHEGVPDHASFNRVMRRLATKTKNEEALQELKSLWARFSSSMLQLNELEDYFNALQDRAVLVFDPASTGQSAVKASPGWDVVREDKVAMFRYPHERVSSAGSSAFVTQSFDIPDSGARRYFLHFVFDDDYRQEGEPPAAYPGFFHKQILIDGEVVWEDDVVGEEPILPLTLEVTRQVRGKDKAEITVRCIDKLGVTNLGVRASVGPIFLSAE